MNAKHECGMQGLGIKPKSVIVKVSDHPGANRREARNVGIKD